LLVGINDNSDSRNRRRMLGVATSAVQQEYVPWACVKSVSGLGMVDAGFNQIFAWWLWITEDTYEAAWRVHL
jgi:hypothetical protein